jgi:hypothetical protein
LQASRDQTVQLIMGPPASGKTTLAKRLCGATPGIVRLSRDDTGGALRELVPRVRKALQRGQSVVLDNLFATAAERRPFIEGPRLIANPFVCLVFSIYKTISDQRRLNPFSGRAPTLNLAPDPPRISCERPRFSSLDGAPVEWQDAALAGS